VKAAADLLREAEELPVEGWDFTILGDRLRIAPLPWDFDSIVEQHIRKSPDLLDLGTGGGEWLATLRKRPPRTIATESWSPNVAMARERLAPLGIDVVVTEPARDNVSQELQERHGRLPFASESFTVITSRHTAFVAAEVARVLSVGGTFLTEQVGGDYGDFYEALGLRRPHVNYFDLASATEQLERTGLTVSDGDEGAEETTFTDVGAFAWYLRMIPWTLEGFSVSRYHDPLVRLQERIARAGPFTVRLPAFWLAATDAARSRSEN
jgi:methyltransferase family protein